MRFNSRGREGLVWLVCVWVIWIARVRLGHFKVLNLFFFIKITSPQAGPPRPAGLAG